MFNKPWKTTEQFNSLHLGGNIQEVLNEHIVVDHKTQNKLKKIVHKLSPSNKYSDLKILTNKQFQLERFLLSFILGQTGDKHIRRHHLTKEWPQRGAMQKSEINLKVPKEKIEISKECQEAIKNVIGRKGKDQITLHHEFIPGCNLSKYELITLRRSKPKRNAKVFVYSESVWTSNIDINLEDIVNEKLTETEYIDTRINEVIEFQYLNVPQINDYLIPLTDRKAQVEYIRKKSVTNVWNFEESTTYPIELFYNLERSLFDDTFHDLEFYLIRIKHCKNDQYQDKNNYIRSKKIWKLDKQLLKSINWTPFKRINDKSIHYFNNLENIKEVIFQISLNTVNFNYLNSSSFDLIDIENKIFNSYQIGLNETHSAIEIPEEKTTSVQETTTASFVTETHEVSTTTETINSSLIPQKRSLLDPSILSIIQAKKMKRKSLNDSSFSKNCTIQNTLSFGINKNPELSITESNWNSLDHDYREQFFLAAPCLPFNMTPKAIIVNSSKLLVNHSILYELRSSQNCDVIEKKIDLMCDFIISSECCITRIKLENFQQCDSKSKLYYSNSFKHLSYFFKKIVVLVDYKDVTEQTDPDLFWKIGLFLNLKLFQVHLINKTNNTKSHDNLILSYILKYITKLSPSTGTNFCSRVGNSDFEFLCKITNNPLLSSEILNQHTLLDFFKNIQLSKTHDEFPITKLLTYWQWISLKSLFAVTW